MDVLLMLVAVLAAFYFILMRPVILQQRRRRSDISQLGVGDEVLTTGGFYATVKEIRTTDEGPMQIFLEAAPGVTLALSGRDDRRLAAAADLGSAGELLLHVRL